MLVQISLRTILRNWVRRKSLSRLSLRFFRFEEDCLRASFCLAVLIESSFFIFLDDRRFSSFLEEGGLSAPSILDDVVLLSSFLDEVGLSSALEDDDLLSSFFEDLDLLSKLLDEDALSSLSNFFDEDDRFFDFNFLDELGFAPSSFLDEVDDSDDLLSKLLDDDGFSLDSIFLSNLIDDDDSFSDFNFLDDLAFVSSRFWDEVDACDDLLSTFFDEGVFSGCLSCVSRLFDDDGPFSDFIFLDDDGFDPSSFLEDEWISDLLWCLVWLDSFFVFLEVEDLWLPNDLWLPDDG